MSDRCDLCKNWYPDQAKLCPQCRQEKPRFNLATRMREPDVSRVRKGK